MGIIWTKIDLPNNNGVQWVDIDDTNIVITDNNGAGYYSNVAPSTAFSFSRVWTQFSGLGVKVISVSNGKFATFDYNNDVYYSNSIPPIQSLSSLTSIGGKMKTISYDATSGIICGVRSDLANNYLSCNELSNNSWTGNKYQIGSTLYGAIYNGNLYVINSTNYDIYYLKNLKTQVLWSNYGYVQRPSGNTIKIKQLDFTDNLLVGVDTSNNVWATYNVYNENPKWFQIPDVIFKQISISNNSVIGVDNSNNIYLNSYSFTPIPIIQSCTVSNNIITTSFIFNSFLPGTPITSVTIECVDKNSPTLPAKSLLITNITYNQTMNFSGNSSAKYTVYSNTSDFSLILGNTYNIKLKVLVNNSYTTSWTDAYSLLFVYSPNKITNLTATPLNNSVNLNYNIPSDNGRPISRYIFRKYIDKNTCTYRELNTTDPTISGKTTGNQFTYKYPTSQRINFTGDMTNLTTNCTKEGYQYIPHNYLLKNMEIVNKKESYIFVLKSVNSLEESEYSEPTSDIVPIVSPAPSPSPSGPSPSPTGPAPTSTGTIVIQPPIKEDDNKNLYIFIGVVVIMLLVFGIGYWYISSKNDTKE
jgi:hypothetical protein